MLSNELIKRGLQIQSEVLLAKVWRNHSDSTEPGVALNSLLESSSVIHYLLGLQDFDLSKPSAPLNGSSPVSNSVLADTILEITRRHSHDTVNEVQLFLALHALCPRCVEDRLAALQEQHRRLFPQGSSRRQQLLRVAEGAGLQEGARQVRETIQETPLSQSRVLETVEQYLSSQYYPFGREQWTKYQAQKDLGSNDSYDLIGFASHRRRDSRVLPA